MEESKNKVVSILISVYNQLHCFEKALNSALDQSYPFKEIIIGDDCSSDGSVEDYLSKIEDPSVKYFRNPRNLGANGNYRNMLGKHANGDFAVVLNADDYWIDQDFLSDAVGLFDEDKEISLVFGKIKTEIIAEKELITDDMHDHLPRIMSGSKYFLDYTKGYSLPHLTCIYNRQKALNLDFYNSNILSTDWEYLLKICIQNKIGMIHHPVGVLTKHRENYSKETDLHNLKNSDQYITNLYDFALNQKVASIEILDEWKRRMLIRHHSKNLVKMYFLDESKIQAYKNYLKETYSSIYSSLVYSFKYLGFVAIRRSPFLLKNVFRIFFKQESFIADLISYKKSKR